MHAVLEKNVIIFATDDSYRQEPQHMSCTWSARVCEQNFAVVRRGV